MLILHLTLAKKVLFFVQNDVLKNVDLVLNNILKNADLVLNNVLKNADINFYLL